MMAFALCRLVVVVLLRFLSFHGFCSCERAPNYVFMKNATVGPPVSYYDYIVVGGGTAGCPLATTLSKSFRVVLLERGGSPYGDANIANLVNYLEILSDLSPNSPSQLFFCDDGVINGPYTDIRLEIERVVVLEMVCKPQLIDPTEDDDMLSADFLVKFKI